MLSKMEPHPLLQPPVLEVLFKYCEFEALKQARQVCKLWWILSTDAFHKSSLINFYNMYPEVYLGLMKSIENGYFCKPVNVALTLSPLFSNHEDLNGLSVCPWSICEEYIFPFGESIEFLKFYAWDSTTEKLNATTFREILETPLNLKALDVSLLPTSISSKPLFQQPWNITPPLAYLTSLILYGKMECSADFLNNFLSAMPNVRNIAVNCCSIDFLDLFSKALYQIPLRKLEDLKLNFVGVFTESQILNITRAKFGLRTLYAAPRSLLTEFDEFHKLLTQLAPTLEDVKLTACTRIPSMEQYLTLPIMLKLKSLRLQNWRGRSAFWNLSFINQVPNLDTLIIEKRGFFAMNMSPFMYGYDMIDEEDVKPHQNLLNLVLPSVPLQYPSSESFISLLGKFSSLKSLTLTADDRCIGYICQYATQLESLTIAEYSEVTDRGLTGLINVDLLPVGFTSSCDVNLGITNLKGLKQIEIDGFAGKVTDFSILHGFMHLENLESMIFRTCKITKWGLKMMSRAHLTVIEQDTWSSFEPNPVDDLSS